VPFDAVLAWQAGRVSDRQGWVRVEDVEVGQVGAATLRDDFLERHPNIDPRNILIDVWHGGPDRIDSVALTFWLRDEDASKYTPRGGDPSDDPL